MMIEEPVTRNQEPGTRNQEPPGQPPQSLQKLCMDRRGLFTSEVLTEVWHAVAGGGGGRRGPSMSSSGVRVYSEFDAKLEGRYPDEDDLLLMAVAEEAL